MKTRDFPGAPVVENSPSNAGNEDSIPGQGTKIPLDMRQLNLGNGNYRAPVPHNKRSHMPRWRSCEPKLRPNAAINKYMFFLNQKIKKRERNPKSFSVTYTRPHNIWLCLPPLLFLQFSDWTKLISTPGSLHLLFSFPGTLLLWVFTSLDFYSDLSSNVVSLEKTSLTIKRCSSNLSRPYRLPSFIFFIALNMSWNPYFLSRLLSVSPTRML